MRRMTYAEAAAGAAAGSSGSDLQQQPSTGTSPSLCSAPSFPDEGEERKRGSTLTSPTNATRVVSPTAAAAVAAAAPAATPAELVGAHPGTVKLLKEQFERQSSDCSLSQPPRLRSSTASAAAAAAAAAVGGGAAGDSRSAGEDSKPWELLSDAKACAEVIQQLLQEKQQLQQQVDSLWSQREAFRCANERISRVLLRQQQQQPAAAAALVAAAEAAGVTPRKDLGRRPVNVVPSGCLTARGPRGPRMNRGLEAAEDALGGSGLSLRLSPMVEGEGSFQSALHHPRQHQQQKRQSGGVPGIAPLNLGAVNGATSSRPRKGLTMRSPLPTAGGLGSRGLQGLVGGALTCRPSLASTALKTPRRRFVDGGISARGAGDRAIQRRGSEEPSPRVAVEEALVASMRSMNLLGAIGLGGTSSSRKKVKAAAAAAAAAGRWEPTPEAALLRCSSVPEKGYWHSTFLCVLKIEGTDFFLDAVLPEQQQQQQQQSKARRSGSSFFSTSSSHPESRGDHGMNQARIIASKETAGAFEVCVRHLWSGDNWLKSVCTSMYWGLPSGIDSAALPPDQTSRQGLRDEDTQAGELGLSRLASTPSESGREDDDKDAGGSSSSWSAWDAVAFMYKHSIDALGAPVPGRAAGESESLYVASRSQDLSRGPSRSNSSGSSKDKGEKTPSTSSSSKSSSSSGSTSNADSRRAEPFSVSNQLILQEGQAVEELFIVRASDRRKGLMPLFHHASRKYLHVHPTMGLVGLVPPVSEQERQLRQQQKEDQQQKKKSKKRLKAKKQQAEAQQQQEQRQQQQAAAGSSNSTTGGGPSSDSSPQMAGEAVTPQSFLKPCRIELIPLGDMVLQQSVQRVLSSVQEAAMQQLQQQLQQEQSYLEQACQDGAAAGAGAAAHSGGSSSCSSSGEEDSFDGVVASEGGEDVDPSTGSSTGTRRPLVPPLGIGAPAIRPVPGAAAAAAAAGEVSASAAPRPPAVVEFRLDDDGVETDVEEVGSVRRTKSNSSSKSSSSNSSSNSSSRNNNSSSSLNSASVGGGQAYDWLSSADPTKQ